MQKDSYTSEVAILGPFYRPSSDLYTRTHERKWTLIMFIVYLMGSGIQV